MTKTDCDLGNVQVQAYDLTTAGDPARPTETPMTMPARFLLPMMICAAFASGALLAPAFAADGYAGKWAADLSNCANPQSSPEAPLVVTAKGYDQHEAHCTFDGLKSAGAGEWVAKAACQVEGDSQSIDISLTVSGDTLTLTEDGAARDLLRCP